MKTNTNSEIVERIFDFGEKLVAKKVTVSQALQEFKVLEEEICELPMIEQLDAMFALKTVARRLQMIQMQPSRRNGSSIDALMKFMEILSKEDKVENNQKCDGDCSNCEVHNIKDAESAKSDLFSKVEVNRDRLDKEELEEVDRYREIGKIRQIDVMVNEYINALKIAPKGSITKFELLIMLDSVRKNFKMGVVSAGLFGDSRTRDVKGLEIKYINKKTLIIDFENMEFASKDEKEKFGTDFVMKYLA